MNGRQDLWAILVNLSIVVGGWLSHSGGCRSKVESGLGMEGWLGSPGLSSNFPGAWG